MSNLKIRPDLFLETIELERLRRSIDEEGFRRNLIENTVQFGLIKSRSKIDFNNGLVEADSDVLGSKSVKMRAANGIDTNGQFFTSPAVNNIQIPGDNSWYWLKIRHAYTEIEDGVFTIAPNGNLVDTSGTASLSRIFRGMPNFPTRIKFTNSNYNTLEYDVIEVTDNQHAILQHPATNGSGIAAFEGESGLKLKIYGTFTPGVAVPIGNYYPFQYDSAYISLIPETAVNICPDSTSSIVGIDIGSLTTTPNFNLARVKSDGTNLIIQDKRSQYWETKGSYLPLEILRDANPLIAIEAVKFNDYFSPADRNIVEVAWGLRSDNWSIDSANNIVTFHSGLGGKYKTVADFNNYDLNGYRLYATNGKYHRITSSIKQGGAINFKLDNLEIDNFSSDGGTTFNPGILLAVPDCEEVEIMFTPNPVDNHAYITEKFCFPVNTPVGRCDVLVYADDTVLYNVGYRYKSLKEYNDWKKFPSDPIGYYTEASFKADGTLKDPIDIVLFPVVTDPISGFAQLKLCPWSLYRFRNKIDKGDLIGVNQWSDFTGITVKAFTVGVDKNYQFITGNITLPNDIYFDLDLASAVEGNEFRFHFDCETLNFGTKNIYFTQAFGTVDQITIKKLEKADVYGMLNQEKGIVLTCKCKVIAGVKSWIISQNYDLGQPFVISMFEDDITAFFDVSLDGKVRGYFGWKIHTIMSGRMPVGYGNVTDANGDTFTFPMNSEGGEVTHTLTMPEIPTIAFSRPLEGGDNDRGGLGSLWSIDDIEGLSFGGDQAHINISPYYVLAFIKKQY